MRGNLAHLLTAQETWYRRLVDSDRPVPDVRDSAAVRSGLGASSMAWTSYADGLEADDLGRILHYVDSSGVPHERSLSVLMLHVINTARFIAARRAWLSPDSDTRRRTSTCCTFTTNGA